MSEELSLGNASGRDRHILGMNMTVALVVNRCIVCPTAEHKVHQRVGFFVTGSLFYRHAALEPPVLPCVGSRSPVRANDMNQSSDDQDPFFDRALGNLRKEVEHVKLSPGTADLVRELRKASSGDE